MRIVKLFLYIFALTLYIIGLLYLIPSSPIYPIPPPDAVQSLEQADTETPLRRAYFTNYNREEVLRHYENALGQVVLFGIKIPTLRLNYPPEDAYTIIRDQTRSTFLEEIVHPGRESLFVNGFKPLMEKDDIWYQGVHYGLKLTVRYIPSSVLVRTVLGALSLVLLLVLLKQIKDIVFCLINERIKEK